MDLLTTAVVDITTLVATCHALNAKPPGNDSALHQKLRSRLRRDLKRGTVAYIDTLARTKRGVVDEAFLHKCRIASEQEMPRALAHQEWLAHIMGSEAGSLDGLAAERQDLWRLAHVAIHLSRGMATLQGAAKSVDVKLADDLAGNLRRRFRKALIAYARAALRTGDTKGRLVINARAAALAEIGPRGAFEAEQLADLEAGAGPTLSVMRQGVVKPLLDLALDWVRVDPESR